MRKRIGDLFAPVFGDGEARVIAVRPHDKGQADRTIAPGVRHRDRHLRESDEAAQARELQGVRAPPFVRVGIRVRFRRRAGRRGKRQRCSVPSRRMPSATLTSSRAAFTTRRLPDGTSDAALTRSFTPGPVSGWFARYHSPISPHTSAPMSRWKHVQKDVEALGVVFDGAERAGTS